MKKLSIWFLVFVMMVSVIFPMSGFATESTESETETEETSTEVVHFNYDFEDYTSSDTSFPKSKTENVAGGSWSTLMSDAGEVVSGADGNAFKFTKNESSGMYATYAFSPYITGGKLLLSFDLEYNLLGTRGREAWVFTNKITTDNGDGTTSTENKYLYVLNFENPAGDAGPSIYSPVASSYNNRTKLLTAEKGKTYSVDVLMDFDTMTKTYYVDGVQKDQYQWTGEAASQANVSQIKMNLNANIAGIDNFKLVSNPSSYTFSAEDSTTEEEWITVNFSDTINVSASDFVITEKLEETTTDETTTEGSTTEEPTQITVSEIEKVTGKTYKIKPSQALAAGDYTVSLTNTALTSVIGTTAANTTADFNVKNVCTYFEIDFEDYTTSANALTYYNSFNQYGSFALANSNDQTKDNTYGFAGDDSMGITCSSSGTRNMSFTPTTPITSGKVTISYDAAFDATKLTDRQQMSYIEDATNGCILTYGISGNVTVIAGAKASGHYSGGDTKAYENNVAYRWDTVIDMDAKTITNYCDGVQFNKVTYTSSYLTDGDIKNIYMRFKPSITFFDNYKITHNVETYGYTASDIATDSNETIINFDDTMVLADGDLVFTNPDGETVVPDSITKITPRKYKVALPDLEEGTYTMAPAAGKKSALGNTPKIEAVTFNVAARPVQEFVATDLAIADAEGGASLSAKITNSFDEARTAVMLIALYDDNNEMIECYAEDVSVDSGAEAVEKAITMTTDKNLTAYTVRGFVWSVEDSFYPLCSPVTK